MKKILFVCLGNICRSPMAEAVFRKLVAEQGKTEAYEIDSAGTAGYHEGCPADERMQQHGTRRGYDVSSISRQLKSPEDFQYFDLIIAMDNSNLRNIRAVAPSDFEESRLLKMTDFCKQHDINEVPDPYYGGESGFELVIDILEDACSELLSALSE